MSETSKAVYKQIMEEGLVTDLQEVIVFSLGKSSEPMTMGEIARDGNIAQRNTLDPRGPELLKLGVIAVAGKRPCKTNGRTVNTYALTGRLPTPYTRPESKSQIITRLTKENEQLKGLLARQDAQLASMRKVVPA